MRKPAAQFFILDAPPVDRARHRQDGERLGERQPFAILP
jgi:hypothetical protein